MKDFTSTKSESAPDFLTELNGALYFAADDGNSAIELWKSDWTSEGTALVRDTLPGAR